MVPTGRGTTASIQFSHGGSGSPRRFDRAGRDCYRRVLARSDTGTALRSAGRVWPCWRSAPPHRGTTHPGAQLAALTVALAAFAAAVADLHPAVRRGPGAVDTRDVPAHVHLRPRPPTRRGRITVLINLSQRAPLLPGVATLAYVDVDDTVKPTFGYAKQGAGRGYTGVKDSTCCWGSSAPRPAGR